MIIKELFVDGRVYPLGVDRKMPAFSWSFADAEERGQAQTAYRIMVSESERNLHRGQAEIWDSGRVDSRRSVHVLYGGAELKSRQRYLWKVQLWDNKGNFTESPVSWWEMGLLQTGDWTAKWLGQPESVNMDSGKTDSAPIFRCEFLLKKPVRRARMYVCGLGHYELRLNGCRVGDRVLEPGWTDYDKTCLYSVYDVTKQLRMDGNAAGIMLGSGFYHVPGGRYAKFKASFGLPKCLVQLEIEHSDGTSVTVGSSREWRMGPSPITFNCIYGGEDYDARLEQRGWDKAGFSEGPQWKGAAEAEPPSGLLKCQAVPPLKVMRTFKPSEISEPRPGVYVIDFGQNFSGWVAIKTQGLGGGSIAMTPAELLKEDGTANQKWTGSPHRYHYTLRGEGVEEWSPRFSYYGFRYVQIEGVAPQDTDPAPGGEHLPRLIDIEGHMIYPDVQPCGSFACSDPLMNRTHDIINWAILSNMKSIFTDCPHREKLGWLEQIHLMGPSVLYNYPVEPLLAKVMEDIRDAQLPNGLVPTTAPEYVVFPEPWDVFRDSVSWGGAYILVAWMMFRQYGNLSILEEHYAGMKKYVEYVAARSEGHIVNYGLGDWYDVGEQPPGFSQNTPVALVETAMFYHIAIVAGHIAAQLGRTEDAVQFAELGRQIKAAFNQTFFNEKSGQYAEGSQTASAMPLVLGLVEEDWRPKVLDRLVEDIGRHRYHTTAGDVGHRYVLLALAQHGRPDLIVEMTRQTAHPSYGYQIMKGATALTEAWDGPVVGKSQNHFMLGHLEEWLYRGLAGIDYSFDPAEEAFTIQIKPYFENRLTWVRARHDLPIGQTSIEWERLDGKRLKLNVIIPANGSAVVDLPPAYSTAVLESGKPLQEAEEIGIGEAGEGGVRLNIPSGSFHFELVSS